MYRGDHKHVDVLLLAEVEGDVELRVLVHADKAVGEAAVRDLVELLEHFL